MIPYLSTTADKGIEVAISFVLVIIMIIFFILKKVD